MRLNTHEAAAQRLHTMLVLGKATTNCKPVCVGRSRADVSYNLYPDRFTCPTVFRRSVERMAASLTRKGGQVFVGETVALSALLPSYGRTIRIQTTSAQSDAVADVMRWWDSEEEFINCRVTYTEVPIDMALELAQAIEDQAGEQENMYCGNAEVGPELDFALRQVRKPYELVAKKLRAAYRRATA